MYPLAGGRTKVRGGTQKYFAPGFLENLKPETSVATIQSPGRGLFFLQPGWNFPWPAKAAQSLGASYKKSLEKLRRRSQGSSFEVFFEVNSIQTSLRGSQVAYRQGGLDEP